MSRHPIEPRRQTEHSPLIGGELSIPLDEGEIDEQRRATFLRPGGGDDDGGGAVDDAAAICASLNGKASLAVGLRAVGAGAQVADPKARQAIAWRRSATMPYGRRQETQGA